MGAIASQITSLTIVYWTVYSDADQRKHQSSASLAFVRGIHRGPVNSPHKWPVTRKMLPFDDVIMYLWVHGGCILRSHKIHLHGLKMNPLAIPWNHRPPPLPHPHPIPTSPIQPTILMTYIGVRIFALNIHFGHTCHLLNYSDMTS